jgi:DNA polymerase III sliding clamp (beta) subunit (PCNA family)
MLGNSVQGGWGRSPVREGGEVHEEKVIGFIPVDFANGLSNFEAKEIEMFFSPDKSVAPCYFVPYNPDNPATPSEHNDFLFVLMPVKLV